MSRNHLFVPRPSVPRMIKILTSTEQKLRSATLPTLRPRWRGRSRTAASAANTDRDGANGVKHPNLGPAKPPLRRSESLFHSKSCTRRPRCRALVFGLTYEGMECRELGIMPLTGCHNDAHSFAELLRNCYGWEDITVMTDEEENFETELWPSTSNMRSKLRDLVAGARPGDMFVVYYAGHSDQVVAINDSQEKDGYDEHMIPVDGAVILDDELRELLIDPLCKGARLTAVFDSCHSGTMLDLYWYPTRTRKSDVTHDRDRKAATLESLVVRSHSMPSPTTIFWGVTKRVKKFPWTAIRAFAKLYAIPKRKARLTTIVPADPPIVTLNEATLPYDTLTVDVALHGNLNVSASDISASDNSSFLTGNTPSTLGELAIHHEPEVIADAHFVAEERADEAPPACKDCEHLANRSPIVNSIAACQDDQQALEDIGKKASIMTPALIDLLTNEPELSARDIQKKLQPKLFQACCRFIVDTLKNKRHPCDRMKKKAKLQRKVMTMVNDMPWQVVQPGAEEDQHMNEPILLCRPGWEGKGKHG